MPSESEYVQLQKRLTNSSGIRPKSGDSPEDFGRLQVENIRADVSHTEHTTALNAYNFTDSGYSTASNMALVTFFSLQRRLPYSCSIMQWSGH